MFAVTTLVDLGGFVTSLATAIALVITALATLKNGKKTDAVHMIAADVQQQVTTINGRTLANLADDNETRRIDAIPKAEQTQGEKEHVEVAPSA